MTPGRKKLLNFLKPHLDAMGKTAENLKQTAKDYEDVVKKHPAKPIGEHTKCGTDECCGQCDSAINELSVPMGTTGKRKKVFTSLVAIRMADGSIKRLPPGKSGSSGGGGGGGK